MAVCLPKIEALGGQDGNGKKPMHVAAYIEELTRAVSKPSVKQHLAELRMLLDWLAVGHVLDVNPADAARGPEHCQKKGKTPVLKAEEARRIAT